MNNLILYIITVLIWGTTWFAIKLQGNYAPAEISIFYRAAFATIFLLIWCKINKLSLKFSLINHAFLCGLGLSMFSLHYFFIYNATNYLVSGVVAVIFSGVSFLTILNNFIFFKIKPSLNVVLGALLGIMGLCVFFWSEIAKMSLEANTIKGLQISAIGTLIFSLGGSISKRNNSNNLKILPSITMGMLYGSIAILVFIAAKSTQFAFPTSVLYWTSIFYLVIFGSIVGFFCYLKLIKNIGAELAGYTTILFPIVALIISSVFEGYCWSLYNFIGLILVALGNIIAIRKKFIFSKTI